MAGFKPLQPRWFPELKNRQFLQDGSLGETQRLCLQYLSPGKCRNVPIHRPLVLHFLTINIKLIQNLVAVWSLLFVGKNFEIPKFSNTSHNSQWAMYLETGMMGRPSRAHVKNGSFDVIHVRYQVENNKGSKVLNYLYIKLFTSEF